MPNKQPFFSVIIPAYNAERFIRKGLESVKNQTFTDYELIVVCDSCTDKTNEVAEEYGAKIINTDVQNDGLARNKGLDIATGEWILFLDADDYFLHEYCFKLLSEKLQVVETDILDFSFVWKDIGYKHPSEKESFVMAWCRAWKRSFIGNNRFKGIPYGADKEFFMRMIKNNPNGRAVYWDMPIYYYNYMREGSMSWMYNKQKYLCIVVTHHDEPLSIGIPFFDMLQHQQNADMSKVSVLFIQDGYSHSDEEINDFLCPYTYDITLLRIKGHGVGTAEARNLGIENCTAQWITFCNFDDMYADVTSMNLILSNFPNDDYDVIWGKYAVETVWCNGQKFINCVDNANFVSCANKYYRTSFLNDNNLRFSRESGLYYDYAFNNIVLAEMPDHRAVTLTSTNYLYYKRFRTESTRHTNKGYKNRIADIISRDEYIFRELSRRGHEYKAAMTVVRTLCNAYHAIFCPDEQERFDSTALVREFYMQNKNIINVVSESDIEVILDESEGEIAALIQSIYNETRKEYYFVNDDKSFAEWMEQLSSSTPAATVTNDVQQTDDTRPERIVAYCGTRNVYGDMVTSAKSLLCHTQVDKIYFFIEDDTFPEELPDIFHCVNVSGQKYFPPNGPNFENTWTYMCMIRAAYPELLKQHSTVLSLDVDIIVNEDISELFDIDMTDYYLAGATEPQRQKTPEDPVYINFGVVMMNLDKLRQDNKQQEIIDILNRKKVDCPEQGAFNEACAGHILPIPNDYNVTVYSHITGKPEREKVLHYAGQRFWKHYRSVRKYSEMTWKNVLEQLEKNYGVR